MLSATSWAQAVTQKVTVENQQVNKNVSQITFNGNDVTLTFDDETTRSADMNDVSIDFVYTTDGIRAVQANGKKGQTYNLKGQKAKENEQGIVIKDGKKQVKK